MKGFLPKAALVLLLVLTVTTGAWAESSVWIVKGAKATVYLAGSCHVLRASDHPLPAEFEMAYARARKIIFEVPPGDLEKPEFAQKLMSIAVYADGTTLQDHLTPAVYAAVRKFCKEHNYPFEQYQAFRPWMVSMMLTMQEMQRIGIESDFGVDHHFHQKAVKDAKVTGGLETAGEQIGFLSLMDGDMDDEQMSETIDDLSQLQTKITDILNAWRRGDEAGIEAFSLRELKNYPQLYSALMIDRNKKWAPKIENFLHAGVDTMVIVGVAHLAGPDSVVDLLRKRGYEVVKLKK